MMGRQTAFVEKRTDCVNIPQGFIFVILMPLKKCLINNQQMYSYSGIIS